MGTQWHAEGISPKSVKASRDAGGAAGHQQNDRCAVGHCGCCGDSQQDSPTDIPPSSTACSPVSPNTPTSKISEGVPFEQTQINAHPSTTVHQRPIAPEDCYSSTAPQWVLKHNQQSKIHAQHHSKSTVLLMSVTCLVATWVYKVRPLCGGLVDLGIQHSHGKLTFGEIPTNCTNLLHHTSRIHNEVLNRRPVGISLTPQTTIRPTRQRQLLKMMTSARQTW